MSKDYLPLKVDPFRFADNSSQLHGYLSVKNMDRLVNSLASPNGDIEVKMSFFVDEQGIRVIDINIAGILDLRCQRCMEMCEYEIISSFKLGLIETEEEADSLPEGYDPLIVENSELFISNIIEDELIVSLPIVPMHDSSICKVKLPITAESNELSDLKKDNPFKIVELLRKKRNE